MPRMDPGSLRHGVGQSPSKVDNLKAGRRGHEQVGLVLHGDARRSGRTGVIAVIWVKRARSHRRHRSLRLRQGLLRLRTFRHRLLF